MSTATSLPVRATGARPDRHRIGDSPSLRSFDSSALFAGSAEIEIVHQGTAYRLKITRQGKLILNK